MAFPWLHVHLKPSHLDLEQESKLCKADLWTVEFYIILKPRTFHMNLNLAGRKSRAQRERNFRKIQNTLANWNLARTWAQLAKRGLWALRRGPDLSLFAKHRDRNLQILHSVLRMQERDKKITWLGWGTLCSSPCDYKQITQSLGDCFLHLWNRNNIECSLCPHSIAKNSFKRCIFEHGSTIRSFLLPSPSCKATPLEQPGVLFPALANLHDRLINF